MIRTHVCRDAQSDDSADHCCIGPHGEDEPWYCVDCGHEGPEPLILPDGTANGNALARMGVDWVEPDFAAFAAQFPGHGFEDVAALWKLVTEGGPGVVRP